MLEKAIQIATKAHAGQTDKAEKPYVFHLFRVANKAQKETEKICAILHDIVEDTHYTILDLKKEGFSDEIANAIALLTKKKGVAYQEYIQKIKENPIARQVKTYDLEDNMDIKRLQNLTEKDLERLNKYLWAYNALKQ